MARFAFASQTAMLWIIIGYAAIIAAWAILWHFVSKETDSDGRKRYSSFWRWWIGKDNSSTVSAFLNLFALFFFCWNVFRIICTILYGYCPVE